MLTCKHCKCIVGASQQRCPICGTANPTFAPVTIEYSIDGGKTYKPLTGSQPVSRESWHFVYDDVCSNTAKPFSAEQAVEVAASGQKALRDIVKRLGDEGINIEGLGK